LSIVTHAAGPESRGASRPAYGYISMSNCFPSFIVRWVLNFVDQPILETTKIDTSRIKVISQYFIGLINKL